MGGKEKPRRDLRNSRRPASQELMLRTPLRTEAHGKLTRKQNPFNVGLEYSNL